MSSLNLVGLSIDLLSISQKAKEIAVLVRSSKIFDKNFTEEKEHPLVQDFKTVSDVIIQEMLRYDISQIYGIEMGNHVFGEEDSMFTNANKVTINLTVVPDQIEMKNNLIKAFGCDEEFANSMIKIIYTPAREMTDINPVKEISQSLLDKFINIPFEKEFVGIWTDPIDGTNEYVKGGDYKMNLNKFIDVLNDKNQSLKINGSITNSEILIGAYDMRNNSPIFGLINSPFHNDNGSNIIAAGLYLGPNKIWSFIPSISECQIPFGMKKLIKEYRDVKENSLSVVCGSGDFDLFSKTPSDHLIIKLAGAGMKCLCVIVGEADLFIKFDNLIYLYDVCGPMAILKSLGGGISSATDSFDLAKKLFKENAENIKEAIRKNLLENEIKFIEKTPNVDISLTRGVIAYMDVNKAVDFIHSYTKSFA